MCLVPVMSYALVRAGDMAVGQMVGLAHVTRPIGGGRAGHALGSGQYHTGHRVA